MIYGIVARRENGRTENYGSRSATYYDYLHTATEAAKGSTKVRQ